MEKDQPVVRRRSLIADKLIDGKRSTCGQASQPDRRQVDRWKKINLWSGVAA
jgi:hypothetical protein